MKTLQMFNSEYGLMLFPYSSFGEMEWWYFLWKIYSSMDKLDAFLVRRFAG